MSLREKRITERKQGIVDLLKSKNCYDTEHGMTADEIAKESGGAVSTVRVDLASLERKIAHDKRTPRKFFLRRKA